MPTFEIPDDGSTTVKLGGDIADPKAPRTGGAVFSVTNKSAERRAGRLSVRVIGETKAEWFAIEGEREREFAPGETQTASVRISVPPDTPPRDYSFCLRVVAVNAPDYDFAEGPAAKFQVEPPIGKKPIPPWVWVVVALVVLAVAGLGAWFLLRPKEKPGPTPTPSPTETSAAVPDLTGKTLDEANSLAGGFDLTPVAGPPAGKPPRTIVSQSPPAGQRQSKGFPIKVTFDPGVAVPQVTGMTTDQAVRTLGPLGLHVASSTPRCEDGGVAGQIVDQKPGAGAQVASSTGVNVFVRTVGGKVGQFSIRCGVRYVGPLKATVRPEILIARPGR